MTDRASALDSNGNEKPRTSVSEAINSPDRRTNSYLSSSELGCCLLAGQPKINQTTELMSETLPAYVSCIDFCKELDLVVCGMGNGSVIQFKIIIDQAPIFNN